MTTAVIVQARVGSQRFPSKVTQILPTGRCVLQEVLRRANQIRGIDRVVCAIPTSPENDKLADLAGAHCIVVRGPEHDVLARYVQAAAIVDADVIMRITADCPLIDPEVCEQVLAARERENADYACNVGLKDEPRTFPKGLDCEVFTRAALEVAHVNSRSAYDREHVTPYLRDAPGVKSVNCANPAGDYSNRSFTLDTKEDYDVIWNAMKTVDAAKHAA